MKTLRNILDALVNLFKKPAPQVEAPKVEIPKPIEKPKSDTPWMDLVMSEKDKVKEIPGPANHPVIVEAHEIAGLKPSMQVDETAWCAAYAKRVFVKSGVSRETLKEFNAWARNMLKFGVKSEFKYGCVMVFERNGAGGDSHVTFGVKQENDYYLCVGGNQSNSVKESKYHKDDLLGIRWPSEDMLKQMQK